MTNKTLECPEGCKNNYFLVEVPVPSTWAVDKEFRYLGTEETKAPQCIEGRTFLCSDCHKVAIIKEDKLRSYRIPEAELIELIQVWIESADSDQITWISGLLFGANVWEDPKEDGYYLAEPEDSYYGALNGWENEEETN